MPVTRRVVRHQFSVPAPPPAAWSPLSLPSLVAWYKSDAGVTDAGAGAVSAWADQSGNGHTVSQGTGANRPTTGTRMVNGINGLDFDGSDDYMTAAIGDLTQPNTVLFVVSLDNTGQLIPFDSNDSTKRNTAYVNVNWQIYAGSNQNLGAAATGAQQGVAIFNGAATKLYIGGTQNGSTVDAGAQNMNNLTIGSNPARTAGFFFNGIICEIVVQNAAISAGDQTNWDTYCARWGL